MIIIFAILALIRCQEISVDVTCQNEGVPILVRSKFSHNLMYKCLCPYLFFGDNCGSTREILCQFGKQKILKYRTSPNSNGYSADVQFEQQCYIKQYNPYQFIDHKPTPTQINFMYLPISAEQLAQQQKKFNYYINDEYQIVWANRTDIFDSRGEIIRNSLNVGKTDEEIFQSAGKYSWGNGTQEHNFFGVPLTGASISYQIKAIKFSNNKTDRYINIANNADVEWQVVQLPGELDQANIDQYSKMDLSNIVIGGINISQLLKQRNVTIPNISDLANNSQFSNRNRSRILCRYTVTIDNQQYSQYQVVHLEIMLKMNYSTYLQNKESGTKIYIQTPLRVSMNGARFRLFNPNYQAGKIIQHGGYRVPASLLLILVGLAIAAAIYGGKIAVRLWNQWKNKRNMKFLQQSGNYINAQQQQENDEQ